MNYYDVSRISNSALSCIDPETGGHPEKYMDFINGKFRQESDSLILGDLIHKSLLENQEMVVCQSIPADAIKTIIDTYILKGLDLYNQFFDLNTDRNLLLQLIRSYGYYNNRKDDTILDHVTKEGNDYFNFMLANRGKTVISSEWFSIIERIRANTLKEPILELLYPDQSGRLQVLTEKEVYFELASKNYLSQLQVFECKAKIDRLIIDHDGRCFKMIDVKSTSTLLEHFPLSVERYKYYRQMSFYLQACSQIVPPGYTLEGVYLLAAETTGYYRSRLFSLDKSYLSKGEKNWRSLLKRISYHQESNNWIHPWEEMYNNGVYLLTDNKTQSDQYRNLNIYAPESMNSFYTLH